MSKLNKDKLLVKFKPCVTKTEPIAGRRYTLTHSDITAELFLVVGLNYAYEDITSMRDEVLGEWSKINKNSTLKIYLHVDGKLGPINAIIRYKVFKKELPLALEAIRYGDREFFTANPELDNTSVIVYFDSKYRWLNRVENWGSLSKYKTT